MKFFGSYGPYVAEERASRGDWVVLDGNRHVVTYGTREQCEAEARTLNRINPSRVDPK